MSQLSKGFESAYVVDGPLSIKHMFDDGWCGKGGFIGNFDSFEASSCPTRQERILTF